MKLTSVDALNPRNNIIELGNRLISHQLFYNMRVSYIFVLICSVFGRRLAQVVLMCSTGNRLNFILEISGYKDKLITPYVNITGSAHNTSSFQENEKKHKICQA